MTVQIEPAAAAAPARLREIGDLAAPPGLPLIGNLLQIDKPHIHRQVERWSREFGPFFRIQLGSRKIFVVADHAAIGAILRDRPDGFRRTQRLSQISQEIGLLPGVFGAEGEAWRRQRKMVMAGFDPRHLRAYFPSLVKVCDRLERRWRAAASAGTAIDLQSDLMRFTVDTISGLAFGADVNTLGSDEEVIQQHLDKIFPALFRRMLAPLPTWRWWKSAADRELDRSIVAVAEAIDGFIASARRRLADDAERCAAPHDLLEAMLVAADDPGSGITDREVAGNVMTMLLAGEDTTANTLAWAIWLLTRHPAALARARAEIDAIGPAADWTSERLADLRYVEACANETMRLKPVAPFLMMQALRETTVADIRVPAETLIWANMRHDSVGEEHFPGAADFDPERWLDTDSAHGAARRSTGSRCRSAPGRASARGGSWRCSRSRWRWRRCSAASRSKTSAPPTPASPTS